MSNEFDLRFLSCDAIYKYKGKLAPVTENDKIIKLIEFKHLISIHWNPKGTITIAYTTDKH